MSEQLGHDVSCDVLVLCIKHLLDPPSPGPGLNWLVGVAGSQWVDRRTVDHVQAAPWAHPAKAWKRRGRDGGVVMLRHMRPEYDGLGSGELHMYPILESVLMPQMMVVSAPAMRDVVHSGCSSHKLG